MLHGGRTAQAPWSWIEYGRPSPSSPSRTYPRLYAGKVPCERRRQTGCAQAATPSSHGGKEQHLYGSEFLRPLLFLDAMAPGGVPA